MKKENSTANKVQRLEKISNIMLWSTAPLVGLMIISCVVSIVTGLYWLLAASMVLLVSSDLIGASLNIKAKNIRKNENTDKQNILEHFDPQKNNESFTDMIEFAKNDKNPVKFKVPDDTNSLNNNNLKNNDNWELKENQNTATKHTEDGSSLAQENSSELEF